MGERIPAALLSSLAEYVAEQLGLDFPEKRLPDLERGLVAAAHDVDIEGVEAFALSIIAAEATDEQIQKFVSRLTVGETYFFRDRPSFEILEQQILPALIADRAREQRRLRIWSAGCCTGEEPYSIAILLAKLIPNLRDWNILILGTDINAAALRHASAGAYRDWSFRETSPQIRNRYFSQTANGMWQIIPEIRQLVAFSFLNLAKDLYPSLETNTNCMDIVLCRNVLMYFLPDKVPPVIEKLHRALSPNGWLFVSPSEATHTLFARFATADFPDAIVFQKNDAANHPHPLRAKPGVSDAPAAAVPETAAASRKPSPQVEIALNAEKLQPKTAVAAASNSPGDYERAQELFTNGSHVNAEEMVLRMADWGSDPRACTLMTRICADQGRLRESLGWSERAIAIDKLNPAYRYLQATVLNEIGEIDAAIQALRHTLYLDPAHILAHFTLGNLLKRAGKREGSEVHYRNALLLLEGTADESALPDSDGLTAGQLMAAIRAARLQQNGPGSRGGASGTGD